MKGKIFHITYRQKRKKMWKYFIARSIISSTEPTSKKRSKKEKQYYMFSRDVKVNIEKSKGNKKWSMYKKKFVLQMSQYSHESKA